jgi:hypothetical protein
MAGLKSGLLGEQSLPLQNVCRNRLTEAVFNLFMRSETVVAV